MYSSLVLKKILMDKIIDLNLINVLYTLSHVSTSYILVFRTYNIPD